LGDFEGTLRVVIGDEVYRSSRAAINSKRPMLVEGQIEAGRDTVEPMVHARRVQRLDQLARKTN
jgi:hypothetical protein